MFPDVVIIPTQGFCNRLRAIASGIVLARHWGTKLYVSWEKESCCNCELEDVFATSFAKIDINEVAQKRHYFSPQQHTNNVLLNVSLEEYDYLVVMGGHEFKHPCMSVVSFLMEKHRVYRSLEFAPAVTERMRPALARFEAAPGSVVVGIHFRDYVPRFDRQDKYNFAEESPLEDFVRIAKRAVGASEDTRLFVSSNTERAVQRLRQVVPPARLITMDDIDLARDSSAGMEGAVCSLLLLSRCKYIVGTVNSSFSDEACFFNNISKLCVGTRPVESYHCHGFQEILGHKMLLPDFNILYDIYKEEFSIKNEALLDKQERRPAV